MVLRKLDGSIFSGRDQLWTALEEAFASIRPEAIKKLYDSMHCRLRCVLAMKGGATRY
jgi:hypothetical protein